MELLSVAKVDAEGHYEEAATAFHAFANGRRPFVLPGLNAGSVPHVGIYSNDDYSPYLPILCVGLPVGALNGLPDSVLDLLDIAVRNRLISGHGEIELWATISAGAAEVACSHFECPSSRHLNLQLHAWAFGDPQEAQEVLAGGVMKARVNCGMFEPHGVGPCHRSPEDGQGTGLPIGDMELMTVLAHDGRFSPNNCNFEVLPGRRDAVFYSVTIDPQRPPSAGQKACVVLHAVPMGDARADEIRAAIRGKNTIGEVLTALETGLPVFARRLRAMVHGTWTPDVDDDGAGQAHAELSTQEPGDGGKEAGRPESAAAGGEATIESVGAGAGNGAPQPAHATGTGASEASTTTATATGSTALQTGDAKEAGSAALADHGSTS